jgi:hypothetical protein
VSNPAWEARGGLLEEVASEMSPAGLFEPIRQRRGLEEGKATEGAVYQKTEAGESGACLCIPAELGMRLGMVLSKA